MRKADYALLAQTIKETREHYESVYTAKPDNANLQPLHAIDYIARRFAQSANVDRSNFLATCKVLPG